MYAGTKSMGLLAFACGYDEQNRPIPTSQGRHAGALFFACHLDYFIMT
jgi:hypothetical protein